MSLTAAGVETSINNYPPTTPPAVPPQPSILTGVISPDHQVSDPTLEINMSLRTAERALIAGRAHPAGEAFHQVLQYAEQLPSEKRDAIILEVGCLIGGIFAEADALVAEGRTHAAGNVLQRAVFVADYLPSQMRFAIESRTEAAADSYRR